MSTAIARTVELTRFEYAGSEGNIVNRATWLFEAAMSTEEVLFHKYGQEFSLGTVLFKEAEQSREMYVINSGKVRISKNIRGHEKTLALLGPGEFFGEMAVLNDRPRSATATVVEDGRMLVIEPRTFEAMIRGSTEIALRMIKRMAVRLQEADDHIENLMLKDPTSRVVHFLVRQQRITGTQVPWTSVQLSSQIGLPPDETREIYERLVKKGMIAVEEDATHVPDPDKLERFLEFLAMREQFGDDF